MPEISVTQHSDMSPQAAFFLPGVAGDILLTYFPAIHPTTPRRDVLLLPPFAEEMNKARRMMALQARDLAKAGIGALLVDLFGTGDSQGDFREARWGIWLDDCTAAMDWLRRQGSESIGLIGLRMGALLAMELAQRPSPVLKKIVLWQPVLDGKTLLTQFLRLRSTASRMNGDRNPETVNGLRARLTAGDTVEVAGYELAPELAEALDRLRLATLASDRTPPLHWIELRHDQEGPLPLISRQVIEQWKKAGIEVSASTVTGQPFWEGKNTTSLPDLIAATTPLFNEALHQ